jgi:hypothetical protein
MERRGFLEKTVGVGVGVWALARGSRALAKDLPSDAGAAAASGPETMVLPGFAKDSPFPLDQALLKRASIRSFDPEAKLSPELLSRLLWATTGANREDGHRTTPSAMARYPVGLYLALPEGVFLFEPKEHKLTKVKGVDIRGDVPLQPNFKKAAMLALYVHNQSVAAGADDSWADLEIGCMVQNLYLKAAAEGLGSCVFALVRTDKASELMGLKKNQKLRIAQAVGPIK